MSSYRRSKGIESVAKRIIKEHHEHLKNASIAYVVKEGEVGKQITKTTKGKNPPAVKARKQNELNCYLAGYDFVIEANDKHWDLLSDEVKEACVDQALCHMKEDSEKGFYIMDTPIQTFPEIIERHGLWTPELKELNKQLLLFKPPDNPDRTESSVVN